MHPSQEREARLRARTICSQIAKVTGKLMASAQQLEVEASAAREAHEADVAGWVTRLRVLGSRVPLLEAQMRRCLGASARSTRCNRSDCSARQNHDHRCSPARRGR